MPLSFSDAIKKELDRINFIVEQEKKAKKRKPKRVVRGPAYGRLYAFRSVRMAIRESANRRLQVEITYRKITTDEVVKRTVCVYSYRYRRTRIGLRKMLFAYDMDDRHIKGFVLGNIRRVEILKKKFVPKWEIEIS